MKRYEQDYQPEPIDLDAVTEAGLSVFWTKKRVAAGLTLGAGALVVTAGCASTPIGPIFTTHHHIADLDCSSNPANIRILQSKNDPDTGAGKLKDFLFDGQGSTSTWVSTQNGEFEASSDSGGTNTKSYSAGTVITKWDNGAVELYAGEPDQTPGATDWTRGSDALTEACTGTDPTAYSSFISDYIHNWDDVQYR